MFIGGATAATVAGLGVSAVLAVLCAKEAISALVAYLALRGDLGASARPAPGALAAAHPRWASSSRWPGWRWCS